MTKGTTTSRPRCRAKFYGRCSTCCCVVTPDDLIIKTLVGWEHGQGDGEGCPADPPDEEVRTAIDLMGPDVGDR